ncbi:hypothetical protein LIA77_04361 [Sarocladium implicatum]|nr:hypothetical protein LIA77_04361 [Sarocladium implicatum]
MTSAEAISASLGCRHKRHDGMTQRQLMDPGQSTLSQDGCTSKRAQAQAHCAQVSTPSSCACCHWILWDALVMPRHAHLSTRAPCTDAHRHAPAPSLSYARQLVSMTYPPVVRREPDPSQTVARHLHKSVTVIGWRFGAPCTNQDDLSGSFVHHIGRRRHITGADGSPMQGTGVALAGHMSSSACGGPESR